MTTRRCRACKDTEKLDRELFQCVSCQRHYHSSCHRTPILRAESWTCLTCQSSGKNHLQRTRKNENPSVSSLPSTESRSSSTLSLFHPTPSTMTQPSTSSMSDSNKTSLPFSLSCSFFDCKNKAPSGSIPFCKIHLPLFMGKIEPIKSPSAQRTADSQTTDTRLVPEPDTTSRVIFVPIRKTARGTSPLNKATRISSNNEPPAFSRGKAAARSSSPAKSGSNRISGDPSQPDNAVRTTPPPKRLRAFKVAPRDNAFRFVSNGVNGVHNQLNDSPDQRENESNEQEPHQDGSPSSSLRRRSAEKKPQNAESPSDFLWRRHPRADSISEEDAPNRAGVPGTTPGGSRANRTNHAAQLRTGIAHTVDILPGRQKEQQKPSVNGVNGTADHSPTNELFPSELFEPPPGSPSESAHPRLGKETQQMISDASRETPNPNAIPKLVNGERLGAQELSTTPPPQLTSKPPQTPSSRRSTGTRGRVLSVSAAPLLSQERHPARDSGTQKQGPAEGRRKPVAPFTQTQLDASENQRREEARHVPKTLFDQARLDAFIYGQEDSSEPPPSVIPNPPATAAPEKRAGPAPTPFYAHIDPRTHWTRPHSQVWLEAKQREIKARGGRKANFGAAARRMRARRMAELDVPFEDTLPEYVRENAPWARALKRVATEEGRIGGDRNVERSRESDRDRGAEREPKSQRPSSQVLEDRQVIVPSFGRFRGDRQSIKQTFGEFLV